MHKPTKIDHHIECLLFRHNYVIVPGFGGFIAKEIPAKIGKSGYTIIPPSKSLVFNANLTANDGLLMQELVLKEKMVYEAAEKEIDRQVKNWKRLLNSGESIVIEGVGMFRKNIDDVVVFRHFAQSNFYKPSFGLEIAKIQPSQTADFANKNKQAAENEQLENQTIVIERLPVSYQRFKTISIASIVILSISATYLYMLSFNPQLVEKAGLNVFKVPVIDDADLKRLDEVKKNEEQFSKVLELHENEKSNLEEKTVASETTKEEEPITEKPTSALPITETRPKIKEKVEVKTPVESKPVTTSTVYTEFHVIASVISSSDKIDEEVQKFRLKGYDPIIIPTNTGTFRISIGKFNTKDSADIFKQNILNDNNINSWILPK